MLLELRDDLKVPDKARGQLGNLQMSKTLNPNPY